ncbi:hypothetical protein NOS3756_11350 [Nostoc sp. NIES-3756]|nr:hypothetical protein NOS3756_11350 [Nostoc sp. NIES-3756]BAY40098.1 hypothetical protein NIES2111_44800 [Nostoc sp. NIES-2111]
MGAVNGSGASSRVEGRIFISLVSYPTGSRSVSLEKQATSSYSPLSNLKAAICCNA